MGVHTTVLNASQNKNDLSCRLKAAKLSYWLMCGQYVLLWCWWLKLKT